MISITDAYGGRSAARTVRRSFRRLAAAAAILLLATTASGGETKLGSIAFEVPRDWKVETDGMTRLVASPAPAPNTPPLVMAEFCSFASGQPCPPAEAPDPAKTGCVAPQVNAKQWSHGVVEKRWTCPRTDAPAGSYSLAVGHFTTPAWTLRVVYIAGDKDKPPAKFLDDLARSIKQH